MRKSDDDVILDLQPIIDSAYESGCYESIDYEPDSFLPLGDADAVWAEAMLRKAGGRGKKNGRQRKK